MVKTLIVYLYPITRISRITHTTHLIDVNLQRSKARYQNNDQIYENAVSSLTEEVINLSKNLN